MAICVLFQYRQYFGKINSVKKVKFIHVPN
jgi:hypothetical protein